MKISRSKLIAVLLFIVFYMDISLSFSNEKLYPITPYIVGNLDEARYQTIQEALNDATKNGGGIIVIQPGTYKENLVLYDKTQIVGAVGLGDFGDFVIEGTHLPPQEGSFVFRNTFLKNEKNIFYSSESGTADLMLIDVAVAVKDGYTFNLPNWKGSLSAFDVGIIGAENDGWIYNESGAPVFMTNLSLGFGSKNSMVISGLTFIFGAAVKCPVQFIKGSKGVIAGGTICEKQVSFLDEASFKVMGSTFESENTSAIVYSSCKNTSLSGVNINSAYSLPIEGQGKGLLTLNGVSFLKGTRISDDLNIDGGYFVTGELVSGVVGKGVSIAEGQGGKIGTSQLVNGKKIVMNSSITNKSRIFLTPQSDGKSSGYLSISDIQPGNSFTINSSNSRDDAIVAWLIVEGI